MYILSYGLLISTAGFVSQVLPVPHIFQVAGSYPVALTSTSVSYPSGQRVIKQPENESDSLVFERFRIQLMKTCG